MNEGWIKVARAMLDHHLFQKAPSEWLKIWLYMLLSANFTDRKWFGGRDYDGSARIETNQRRLAAHILGSLPASPKTRAKVPK
jgi:hypothetical protein